MVNHEGEPLTLGVFNIRKRTTRGRLLDLSFYRNGNHLRSIRMDGDDSSLFLSAYMMSCVTGSALRMGRYHKLLE